MSSQAYVGDDVLELLIAPPGAADAISGAGVGDLVIELLVSLPPGSVDVANDVIELLIAVSVGFARASDHTIELLVAPPGTADTISGAGVGDDVIELLVSLGTGTAYTGDHVIEVLAPPEPLVPAQGLSVSLLDSSPIVYAPSAELTLQSLLPTLLDSGAAVYDPTVTLGYQILDLVLIDSSPTVYDPTLGGSQTLTVPLLDSNSAVYSPAILHVSLLILDLVDSGPATYPPAVVTTQLLTLTLLDSSPTVYSPLVAPDQDLTLVLVDSSSVIYSPAATPTWTISLGLLAAPDALYDMTVAKATADDLTRYTDNVYDGRYTGESQAIHSEIGYSSTTPAGPVDLENAKYAGEAPKIYTHPNSPPQWHDNEIYGPLVTDTPIYPGRSQAIHVFGDAHSVPPHVPIDSCDCTDYGYTGGKSCGDANLSGTHLFTDDLNRTLAGYWGISGEAGGFSWRPTFATDYVFVNGTQGVLRNGASQGLGNYPGSIGTFTVGLTAYTNASWIGVSLPDSTYPNIRLCDITTASGKSYWIWMFPKQGVLFVDKVSASSLVASLATLNAAPDVNIGVTANTLYVNGTAVDISDDPAVSYHWNAAYFSYDVSGLHYGGAFDSNSYAYIDEFRMYTGDGSDYCVGSGNPTGTHLTWCDVDRSPTSDYNENYRVTVTDSNWRPPVGYWIHNYLASQDIPYVYFVPTSSDGEQREVTYLKYLVPNGTIGARLTGKFWARANVGSGGYNCYVGIAEGPGWDLTAGGWSTDAYDFPYPGTDGANPQWPKTLNVTGPLPVAAPDAGLPWTGPGVLDFDVYLNAHVVNDGPGGAPQTWIWFSYWVISAGTSSEVVNVYPISNDDYAFGGHYFQNHCGNPAGAWYGQHFFDLELYDNSGNTGTATVIDNFDRADTTSPDLGTATIGEIWTNELVSTGSLVEISGNRGHLYTPSGSGLKAEYAQAELPNIGAEILRFDVTVAKWGDPTDRNSGGGWNVRQHNFSVGCFKSLPFSPWPSPILEKLTLSAPGGVGSISIDFALTEGATYHVLWEIQQGVLQRVKVYTGSEPSAWTLEQTGVGYFGTDNFIIKITGGSGSSSTTFYPECEVYFDNLEDATLGGGSSSGSCPECEDPYNPGFQLPAFTPGYMPIFRRQIGDPQTTLDSYLCTMESGAMVLDWHTRGAIQVWGGDLVQHCGRSEASIIGSGTNLDDLKTAWAYYGQYLSIRSGQTWDDLIKCLSEGRAVVLQGDYGEFPSGESCQPGFVDNHAISVYPYQVGDRLLVGDPICYDFKGRKITTLQAYAEALGVAVFGVTSPQKILFAASRPWTP